MSNGQHASTMRLAREEFVADHVNHADVEVAHHPPRLNPVGGQASVRAHVTDVEAKLDEKT